MAGSKLTELTDISTSVTGDDLVYIVDAPGGTPASRKITVADLLANFNTESIINVKANEYGAKGDGVTDDTAAILLALNAATTSTRVKQIRFPAGIYVITSDGLLSSFTASTKSGLVISGDGMDSSILYLKSPGAGTRWFYNNNGVAKMDFATFRDLRFEGESPTYCSGFAQDSDGHDKDFDFHRCEFKNLGTAFKSTGTACADHNTFYDCFFNGIYSKVLHLDDNAQSVLHQFHDCLFYIVGGDCIYVSHGGCVEMTACSIIMWGTGVSYVLHDVSTSGDEVGTGNDGFFFTGCRCELLTAEKRLVYGSYARQIMFYAANFATTTGGARTACSIMERGSCTFRDCIFPTDWSFETRTTVTGYIWSGAGYLFDSCLIDHHLSERITFSDDTYPYGFAKAINSRSFNGYLGEPYDAMFPLDFHFNQRNSGQESGITKEFCASIKQTALQWPYSTSERLITLPRTIAGGGALLVGIDFYKPASGADTTPYNLKLGNSAKDVVYWSSGLIAYNAEIKVHVDLWIELSDAARVIRLWADPTGGGATITGGYAYLRYR